MPHLHLYGPLKDYTSGQTCLEVPAGQTVRAALQSLGIPPYLVALVVVNEEPRDKDYLLQENDQVRLTVVIGGG